MTNNNPANWAVPEGEHITYFTDEELRRVFAAIRANKNHVRDLAMFSLMLSFGLRVSELLLLKVTDFKDADATHPQLNVTRVKRKRDPVTHLPKPRLSHVYDLTRADAEALRAYLKLRRKHRAAANPAMFLSSHATAEGAGFSGPHIFDLVRSYGVAAGLPKAHPHQFRHTTAVKMAQASLSAYDIMHQLGHTSVLSGQTYVNRFGAERQELSKKIAKALEFDK